GAAEAKESHDLRTGAAGVETLALFVVFDAPVSGELCEDPTVVAGELRVAREGVQAGVEAVSSVGEEVSGGKNPAAGICREESG
ncbi:unnamed protein product, partial [Amoebophrya sp. A120]